MTIRNLNYFFEPTSVALIGASAKPHTIGATLAKNFSASGFKGLAACVNPKYSDVSGIACFASIDALPFTPDLAIVATPAATVPSIIANLSAKGTKAAVVISSGVEGALSAAMLEASKPHRVRIIGPNSLGIQAPHLHLDASFAQNLAKLGDIALIAQSGAITTAMLDWAAGQNVGFSHVISIGDMADVDLGDMLDYLAGDVLSRAVFVYLEQVTHAQKFMSAARRCARAKPVIAIKAGRRPEESRVVYSHTGALSASDAIYDAALRRAGVLRVFDLDEMFAAAEMLAFVKTTPGNRVSIVTNGDGAGVLATDALFDLGGRLAELDPKTVAALEVVLPAASSRKNPVYIASDAGPERYAEAVRIVVADPNTDALLVMHSPNALASPLEDAKATVAAVQAYRKSVGRPKPVIAAWLGAATTAAARGIFLSGRIPEYASPGAAVRGFMQLAAYSRAQTELMRTPPALPAELTFDAGSVREQIAGTLAQGRTIMTEPQSKAVLEAYGIPTVPTRRAKDVDEVGVAAAELLQAYPSIVVKILSPDVGHKTDVGGVKLDLRTPERAQDAARAMLQSVKAAKPDAHIEGFTVQPMIRHSHGYELLLGMSSDPVFGPVLMFGAGGTSVEAIRDTAVGLPPLDLKLAADMIASTRISRLLGGFRERPPVDLEGLALCLVKLSALAVSHPEIRELDINPLLATEKRLIALDARIRVRDLTLRPATPPAIRPYPAQWEATRKLLTGREVFIRPVRPEDEPLLVDLMSAMTPDDVRLRLFVPVREFSHQFLALQTQIDYAREIAFVAIAKDHPNEMLGMSRFCADPDYVKAEYAVMVRSDLKGQGLGWELMNHLISYAKAEGLSELYGSVLRENTTMLQMCRQLGFDVKVDPEDIMTFRVTLSLKG